jgi:hypothetical protein
MVEFVVVTIVAVLVAAVLAGPMRTAPALVVGRAGQAWPSAATADRPGRGAR